MIKYTDAKTYNGVRLIFGPFPNGLPAIQSLKELLILAESMENQILWSSEMGDEFQLLETNIKND